jgi:hypothetical protein
MDSCWVVVLLPIAPGVADTGHQNPPAIDEPVINSTVQFAPPIKFMLIGEGGGDHNRRGQSQPVPLMGGVVSKPNTARTGHVRIKTTKDVIVRSMPIELWKRVNEEAHREGRFISRIVREALEERFQRKEAANAGTAPTA